MRRRPRDDEAIATPHDNEAMFRTLEQKALDLEFERARLVDAQRLARIGSWEMSIATSELIWSDELLRIFEIHASPADSVGQQFLDTVHPDDRAEVVGAFLRSFDSVVPVEIENRLLMSDGRVKHVLHRLAIVRDKRGDPLRALGTCEDVSERREADRALRQSEALHRTTSAELSTLLDNSLDLICSFDAAGRFIRVNRASESVLGYSPDVLMGAPYITNILADDRDKTRLAVSTARAGIPVRNFENRCRRSNGSVAQLQWTIQWSEQEQIMFCVGRDVTEAKHLEAQALRAQRMESIGTLAGGIAHDLNNVLSPIMMSIQLLKLDDHDARWLDMLNILESSARRGADMVQQLLSFGRDTEFTHTAVSIAQLLAEVKQIADETFLKSIDVRLELADDLWVVEGDSTQLHQVLLNLCVNARDALPTGGTLVMSARNVLLDDQAAAQFVDAAVGPYVVIDVVDTGLGMTAETLDRAFEPFFTTKGVGKGTGLGLATSQAIVKRHHGFLRVTSEPGVGTAVTVFLRANPGNAGGAGPGGVDLIRGNGELVLVVDDETAIRQITQRTLQTFGYRVLLAADGNEAVAQFEAHRGDIAVVITDMMMPNVDGPTLIGTMMRSEPGLKIIATSGLSAHEVVAAAKQLGVALFLPKPIAAEILLQALHGVLHPSAPAGDVHSS